MERVAARPSRADRIATTRVAAPRVRVSEIFSRTSLIAPPWSENLRNDVEMALRGTLKGGMGSDSSFRVRRKRGHEN